MLACHPSDRTWLEQVHFSDSWLFMLPRDMLDHYLRRGYLRDPRRPRDMAAMGPGKPAFFCKGWGYIFTLFKGSLRITKCEGLSSSNDYKHGLLIELIMDMFILGDKLFIVLNTHGCISVEKDYILSTRSGRLGHGDVDVGITSWYKETHKVAHVTSEDSLAIYEHCLISALPDGEYTAVTDNEGQVVMFYNNKNIVRLDLQTGLYDHEAITFTDTIVKQIVHQEAQFHVLLQMADNFTILTYS